MPSFPTLLTLVAFSTTPTSTYGQDTLHLDLTTSTSYGHGPIPSDFASFSYEVSCVPKMFMYNNAPRPTFQGLMLSLQSLNQKKGPNIRIGGNSADESAYVPDPNTPLPDSAKYRITDADFHDYLQAVPLWHGSITPGLNFRGGSNSSLELAHAKGISAVIPYSSGLIEAFEVGNEPDLYPKNGDRPQTWGGLDYAREARGVMANLMGPGGNVPNKLFQGATFCCHKFDAAIPAYLDDNKDALATLSYHEYPLSVCEKQTNTLPQLLAATAITKPIEGLTPIIAEAKQRGIPFYIGEGNSVSCGGQVNVSDVAGTALWAVDTLLSHASAGIARWNFHGCTEGPYTAIAYEDPTQDTPDVRPLYYGMYSFTFATMGGGEMMQPKSMTSSSDLFRAHAVKKEGGGGWSVTAIHKDISSQGAAGGVVSVTLPLGSGVGTLTRLLAPHPLAKEGLTFGGLTWDGTKDGKPTGTPKVEKVTQGADGVYTFAVPQGSVAILTV